MFKTKRELKVLKQLYYAKEAECRTLIDKLNGKDTTDYSELEKQARELAQDFFDKRYSHNSVVHFTQTLYQTFEDLRCAYLEA